MRTNNRVALLVTIGIAASLAAAISLAQRQTAAKTPTASNIDHISLVLTLSDGGGETTYTLTDKHLDKVDFNRLAKLFGTAQNTQTAIELSPEQLQIVKKLVSDKQATGIGDQDLNSDPQLPDAGRYSVSFQINGSLRASFTCAETGREHRNISGARCVEFVNAMTSVLRQFQANK